MSVSVPSVQLHPPTDSDHSHTDREPCNAGGILQLGRGIQEYGKYHKTLLARATLRDRIYTLERFTRHLGPHTAVKAIQPRDITDWLNGLGVAASTMRLRLGQIRAFFRWTVQQGWCRTDPTLKPPRQPRALPRGITSDDAFALDRTLPDSRARLIVCLGIFEGLRRAEICGLELDDIHLPTDTIRVVGKGGHERVLPLTAGTRHFLEQYIQEERGRGGGALIRSRTTGGHLTPSSLGHLVAQWMKDAGIKQSPFDGRSCHALRHSMAGNLFNRGVDLRTIAVALGHASPQTTWIYLRHHADLAMLRQVMGQPLTDEAMEQVQRIAAPYQTPAFAVRGAS